MCGIVGYIGDHNALPVLLEGLRRLEYRGYDSAGVAVRCDGSLAVHRRVGKVRALAGSVMRLRISGSPGIAHTRWATHGEPTELNAHPHVDCSGNIALVHNGIIENHAALRAMLERKGHRFASATDSETIVHLIEEMRRTRSFPDAVGAALRMLEGTYGLAIISSLDPGLLIAARRGSPIVVGAGDGEYIVASDTSAIAGRMRRVLYLNDGETAVLSPEGVTITDADNAGVPCREEELAVPASSLDKGEFPHYMLKEICEQPRVLQESMRARLLPQEGSARLGGIDEFMPLIAQARRIILAGCGTSWHAALIAKYMIEDLAGIPVEVEYASEFRYRNPVLDRRDVVVVISQSGETADTLAALRLARARHALCLAVSNVVGSTIARESDGGVFIHAGPEIGVASTKAFTSQLLVLALMTLAIARVRGLCREEGKKIVAELAQIPRKAGEILAAEPEIRALAAEVAGTRNFLYLARGYNFPVALEGALKMKEISYIHAEGYPAAEMKHGPIALIDEEMPVLVVAPGGAGADKIKSNIEEVRARKAKVILIATAGDEEMRRLGDRVITIPSTIDMLTPLLAVIPLQLLAYHCALLRGCDVDQPRNLAKSVTVE